jgi:NitT/TauT family transport system permease protein
MMKNKKKKEIVPLWGTLLLMAVFLLLWQLLANTGKIDTFFFSSPLLIWQDLLSSVKSGLMIDHTLVTLQESFWGLFWGCLLGTAVALAFGVFKKISHIVMPIMVGLNGLPKIAFAPMFIIWFGIGIKTKIVMSACMVFFIFLFNMHAGYTNVDVNLTNSVKMLGGNRWQIIRKVVWPSCIPWFFASLHTGLGLAVTGAIVGEFIGSSKGLGYQILDAGGSYNMTRVLSCIVVLIIVMAVLEYIIKLFEKLSLRWRPEAS